MPKSNSIRVSEKHGVNPTIPICFWCGNEKNEIAMLGKLPNDQEAPRSMWIFGDYEPCEECQKIRDMGVDLIEATLVPSVHENQPPMMENENGGVYPTGRHIVMKEHAIRAIFESDKADILCEKRMGFVDPEPMEALVKMIQDVIEDNVKEEE